MPLAPGTTLGPYRIDAALGAGGMGEVYQATDTRLDRTVAVKVLPAELASDPERRERFEREAKTISSLNHPHICTLHDVGHQNGIDFLVMEHLEGDTLQDRLTKGALPLDQALKYAIEIADALDKAHRQGIVHRDLKPGNIMLTKAGAKLLDFGLAKPRGPADTAGGLSALPTQEANLTAEGSIVGTFQYMAPEQLEGREADSRTDIWAFGCVVYEMVAGKKAFEGKSQASLIHAIMGVDPRPISTLQPLSPVGLDRLVAHSLAKNPEARWSSAHDLKMQLQQLRPSDEAGGAAGSGSSLSARPWAFRGLVAATVVLSLATLGLALGYVLRPSPPAPPVLRLSVSPPPGGTFTGLATTQPVTQLALSPDGRTLVYVAVAPGETSRLWIRDLDASIARPLTGTDLAMYPFWSPDGLTLGFFTERELKRINLSDGSIRSVTALDSRPRGGAWGADDTIVFGTQSGLLAVAASGGVPESISDLARGQSPNFLPDGRRLLFNGRGTEDRPAVYLVSLDDGSMSKVLDADSTATYQSGYLLWVASGRLLAQRFDPNRLELTGAPAVVADDVGLSNIAHAAFSVSETGVLAYAADLAANARLRWFDRSGRVASAVGEIGERVTDFHLSPDSSQLIATRHDPLAELQITAEFRLTTALWLTDLSRGVVTRFSTLTQRADAPTWAADGRSILYRSNGLARRPLGGGQEERVAEGGGRLIPLDWSSDGSHVIAGTLTGGTGFDLALVDVTSSTVEPFLATPADEWGGQFSPDGRWVAYSSNESGTQEIYVRAFDSDEVKLQLSQGGGAEPRWRADGTELFYLAPDGTVMAVAVEPGATLAVEAAVPLFRANLAAAPGVPFRANYDVTADGQRFLINVDERDPTAAGITILVNWQGALEAQRP